MNHTQGALALSLLLLQPAGRAWPGSFEEDSAAVYSGIHMLLAQAQPGGTGFDRLEAFFNAGTQPAPDDPRNTP